MKKFVLLISTVFLSNLARMFYGDVGANDVIFLNGETEILDQFVYKILTKLSLSIILYVALTETTHQVKAAFLFLFIISCLDILHYAFLRQQGLVELKYITASIISYITWKSLKH